VKYIKTPYQLKSLIFCDGTTIALGTVNGNIQFFKHLLLFKHSIGTVLIYDLRNYNEPKNVLLGNKGEVNHLDFTAKKISNIRSRKILI